MWTLESQCVFMYFQNSNATGKVLYSNRSCVEAHAVVEWPGDLVLSYMIDVMLRSIDTRLEYPES